MHLLLRHYYLTTFIKIFTFFAFIFFTFFTLIFFLIFSLLVHLSSHIESLLLGKFNLLLVCDLLFFFISYNILLLKLFTRIILIVFTTMLKLISTGTSISRTTIMSIMLIGHLVKLLLQFLFMSCLL